MVKRRSQAGQQREGDVRSESDKTFPAQGVSRNNRNASTSYVVWKQLRQHGGLGLGTAACLGTILVYDQKDSWRVLKIIGFMVLALLGLLIHEIRPFKRMNYGDIVQDEKEE